MNTTIFSEPLENILQEKLFKANTIVLEVTVSNVLESTLEIRDKILDRLKNIREGKQEICKDQNVGQEDFLSMVRMEMMRVILKIIEEGEATTDRLQVKIIHFKFFVKLVSQKNLLMKLLFFMKSISRIFFIFQIFR